MKPTKILKDAEELCNFIRKKCTNKYGLYKTELFDVDSLKWKNDICDVDDLGDFAIFMVWLDKIKKTNINEKWIEKVTDNMKSKLKQKLGLYYPYSTGKNRTSQSRLVPLYPEHHIDLILGFNMLYRLTKNKKYLKENIDLCNGILKYCLTKEGFVYGAFIPYSKAIVPKKGSIRHSSAISGIFIEEMINLYNINKNEKYLKGAEKLLNPWLKTKAFKKYGLFPTKLWPYTKVEVNYSDLYKSHINMISGMIKIYETTKKSNLKKDIEKALKAIELFKDKKGAHITQVNTLTGTPYNTIVNGAVNHSVIEIYLNWYNIIKNEKYLNLAEKAAEFWIKTQSKNGLYLQFKFQRSKGTICEIDPHCDMMIEIGRIYKLTKNKRHYNSFIKALKAIDFFKAPNKGYYMVADYTTGKPLIKTNILKFLGGALKGILFAYVLIKNDKSIDKETHELIIRDR